MPETYSSNAADAKGVATSIAFFKTQRGSTLMAVLIGQLAQDPLVMALKPELDY
jgi:hypothetical protein